MMEQGFNDGTRIRSIESPQRVLYRYGRNFAHENNKDQYNIVHALFLRGSLKLRSADRSSDI